MRYLATALLVSVVACDAEMRAPERMPTDMQDAAPIQASRAVPEAAPAPAVPGTDASALDQIQDPAAAPMIIRTGQITIEVDSIEPAIAAVRALAARVGGYVGATSTQGGDDQVRSASIELKIPANRWADALSGLRPIGEVESVQENAQDVGEEFVDVTARLTNARRLEARLVELLERRTGRLEDVLMVERELNRVREEIERYEGRLRYLRTRVATSTLVVNLHEPGPLVGAPGENVLVDAFRDAWRNFVHFIAWLISASGILIPLAVLAGLLVWGAFRVQRFVNRKAGESDQPAPKGGP